MLEHKVSAEIREMPIAAYLRRAYPAVPVFAIREVLKKRDVRINGVRSGAEAVVRGGDELKIYLDERYTKSSLRILYRDAGLLVVEKPQGLPVDTDGAGVGQDTLLARAKAQFPAAQLCHRLDAGTGGAIMLSLDEKTHAKVLAAFREERVGKQYALAVLGRPAPAEGNLTGYIVKNASASTVKVLDRPSPGAKTAVTEYRVVGAAQIEGVTVSFVRARIHTGRTHQIRAQMAHAGWPLIGDDKYGDRAANAKLHAKMPSLWCEELVYEGQVFRSEPRFPLWKELR
nr:RluA family pseudouridine synthase [Eubacteriales bacterium]